MGLRLTQPELFITFEASTCGRSEDKGYVIEPVWVWSIRNDIVDMSMYTVVGRPPLVNADPKSFLIWRRVVLHRIQVVAKYPRSMHMHCCMQRPSLAT